MICDKDHRATEWEAELSCFGRKMGQTSPRRLLGRRPRTGQFRLAASKLIVASVFQGARAERAR